MQLVLCYLLSVLSISLLYHRTSCYCCISVNSHNKSGYLIPRSFLWFNFKFNHFGANKRFSHKLHSVLFFVDIKNYDKIKILIVKENWEKFQDHSITVLKRDVCMFLTKILTEKGTWKQSMHIMCIIQACKRRHLLSKSKSFF